MFLTGWQISWCQGIRGGSFRYWWHSIRCYLRGRSFQRIRSGIWWHCSFQEGKFYELESDQNEIGFFHLWMKVVFKWSMRRSFKCYIFKKNVFFYSLMKDATTLRELLLLKLCPNLCPPTVCQWLLNSPKRYLSWFYT